MVGPYELDHSFSTYPLRDAYTNTPAENPFENDMKYQFSKYGYEVSPSSLSTSNLEGGWNREIDERASHDPSSNTSMPLPQRGSYNGGRYDLTSVPHNVLGQHEEQKTSCFERSLSVKSDNYERVASMTTDHPPIQRSRSADADQIFHVLNQ